VDFDPDHVADVGARIRGRVTRVMAGVGDAVEVGTALVEIESVSLGDVLAARVSAQAQATAARARLARETELYRQRLTTARAVEDARADVARFEAEATGAMQRLAAMGAGAGGSAARSSSPSAARPSCATSRTSRRWWWPRTPTARRCRSGTWARRASGPRSRRAWSRKTAAGRWSAAS
jgi:hypothetical protein